MNLVPDRWYCILRAGEVPTGRPVAFRRMGEDLVFWRDGSGQPRAALDRCPHRGAALSLGALQGDSLACPYHGFRFDPGGACVAIPAHPDQPIPRKMALRCRRLAEAHGFIWLWNGHGEPVPAEPPFFDFTGYSCAGSAFQARWETHYARVVENEFDFAHLPFVHHNTIGRGFPKPVDIEVKQDGDHLSCWLTRDPAMVLEVRGPNLWRMPLGPKVYNFIAFAPIDDEAVMLYLRTYQRIATWAPLAWVIGRANALINPVVLRQDARTVPSQRPKVPSLTDGDVFVASDKAIVAFLRWRARAQRTASAESSGDTLEESGRDQ